MPELVEITDPYTGETYHVHPWIAEHGTWFAQFDGTPEARKDIQSKIPRRDLLLKDLARLAQALLTRLPIPSDDTKPITHSPSVRERVGNGE